MASTHSTQPGDGNQRAQAMLPPSSETQQGGTSNFSEPQDGVRRVGYGLPCAKCGAYYLANLAACPICKCGARVSPTATPAPATVVPGEPLPDAGELEEERERFLREFKSQLYAAHMQINSSGLRCSLEENHEGGCEPPTVCKSCYDRLQERVDQVEAALHMDPKEAAQVVYDAVWADASDPSKTYQNAALALLAELRRRAGITLVLGPFQPYSH